MGGQPHRDRGASHSLALRVSSGAELCGAEGLQATTDFASRRTEKRGAQWKNVWLCTGDTTLVTELRGGSNEGRRHSEGNPSSGRRPRAKGP